jgi:hypothetical protein
MIEKKHQIDACSMRLGVIAAAMTGPVSSRKVPWISMPRFSHMARKGANIMNAWICAEGMK